MKVDAPEKNAQGRMMVVAVSQSPVKGVRKVNLAAGLLVAGKGLDGDAHADGSHRQLSLLGLESIEAMRRRGILVNPGDFAENVTTLGICLYKLSVGMRLEIGGEIELEVTQIGKTCHSGCEISRQTGTCVMPREGIFCRILRGGLVRPGAEIRILGDPRS